MDIVQPTLDLYRIFFGSGISFLYIAEVFVRTIFLYLYTLLNIRIMHTRSIGQLTPFELIIVIALGSAVGDPMFYHSVPLFHGMLVITITVLLENLITYISDRNSKVEAVLEGKPALIIERGTINEKNLIGQGFSKTDLLSRLRLHGIKNIGQVEYAFIETSGQLSIIQYAPEQYKKGISTITPTTNKE